ncbi:MAG TPA: M81 family metallopeptidase [Steroidobacteraceae bacterium]|nr:M81 family metallopeptidase [Steroidobacteraceae bacterium]
MTHFVIARFQHETNTFAATATPPEAFTTYWGEDARASMIGSDWPMAPLVELAERLGATATTPVAAEADPSNRVADTMFERVASAIVGAVEQGCDAVLLELHGAMVTQSHDDGEGELLARVRRAAPRVPIFVTLDLHGNITQRMMNNVDVVVGYKTYPHVDYRQTGEHAAELARRSLIGEIRPVTRWRPIPVLAYTLAMGTDSGPMARAVAAAREAEREPGVLAVSIFGGFPLADIADAGVSVVATTDGDAALAQRVADRIGAQLWAEREGLIYRSPPLAVSLAEARALADRPGEGPVLLFDHSDNVYSGGTADTMDVLQGALAAGLTGLATSPICDPEAVAQIWAAGVGADLEVQVGNKVPQPMLGRGRDPMRIRGRVTCLHDGEIPMPNSIYGAYHQSLGRTAVLDAGTVKLIVSEKRNEPCDPKLFSDLGIDPRAQRFLLIKSRMHCKPIFMPLARGLIQCDSDRGGPTSSQISLFPIRHMRRPLFPLDRHFDWRPE